MMDQHKHNPTAIAAANGMLPPKPKKLDKRENERFLESMVWAEIYNRTGMMLSLNGEIMIQNPKHCKP